MYHQRELSSPTTRARTWKAGEIFTVTDATELYELDRWGKGYFSISDDGHVRVHPTQGPRPAPSISSSLTDQPQLRGIGLPILLRFTDILRHRLGDIHGAFQTAIDAARVQGRLLLRLPDQGEPAAARRRGGPRFRPAVSTSASRPARSRSCWPCWRMADNDTPIICNGFKDAEFIEMAMLAQKIGRQHHPGRREVHRAGADPRLRREGRRPAAASACASSWPRAAAAAGKSSGGYRSKFGLTVTEVLRGARRAEGARHAGLLQAPALPPRQPDPQHPHRQGRAERGGAHLRRAASRRGAGLEYLDVGGGLGVDYDGSQTNFESSVNYTLQEYANDVVYHIQTRLRRGGREAPDDRLRERPRDGRVPQRAGLQRAGRVGLRRGRDAAERTADEARAAARRSASRPIRT